MALQRRDLRAPLCLVLARVARFAELGLSAAGLAASAFGASVLASVFASVFAASVLVSALLSSLSAPCRLRLFSLSDLKSVSYQPEPFRRNSGADMSLRKEFLPQLGHFFRGLSVIFCSTSSR